MLIDNDTHIGKIATTLKPSQAMRVGAALRPQCRGQYFADGGSCALGAMWEGFGKAGNPDSGWSEFGLTEQILTDVVVLNDRGWTREQIATWLEGQGL